MLRGGLSDGSRRAEAAREHPLVIDLDLWRGNKPVNGKMTLTGQGEGQSSLVLTHSVRQEKYIYIIRKYQAELNRRMIEYQNAFRDLE